MVKGKTRPLSDNEAITINRADLAALKVQVKILQEKVRILERNQVMQAGLDQLKKNAN